MNDTLFKLKVLLCLLKDALTTWRDEVMTADLDGLSCCEGKPEDECACGGATVRDVWESIIN